MTENTDNGHIWHEKVFSSMRIRCCMNCGFILNENQPNKPCPGPIKVGPRLGTAFPGNETFDDEPGRA